ncbi:MAG: RsmE family RNA methyltransferase [Actinomycetota bacterium]|nr:RsmE family RNA methyltransferase [Actinomycetota bacterium]
MFVDDLDAPVLAADDRHHLERVLRLRSGDDLTISDGAGRWRSAVLGAELDGLGPIVSVDRPSPALTVGFALVKGERPEWTVQKLTELGVDHIVPLTSDRTVVRWDGQKAVRNTERLRRIAREAAMQCRRVWLPEVASLTPFDDVLGGAAAADAPVCVADPGGRPPTLERPSILVGPEGGWSEREHQRVDASARVALGPHILRAETAAIAAGTALALLRAGLVRMS